jgi:hypothetical protein
MIEPIVDRSARMRAEIAALLKENQLYATQPSHSTAEKRTHALRRSRLEAIREDLIHLRSIDSDIR